MICEWWLVKDSECLTDKRLPPAGPACFQALAPEPSGSSGWLPWRCRETSGTFPLAGGPVEEQGQVEGLILERGLGWCLDIMQRHASFRLEHLGVYQGPATWCTFIIL